MDLDVYGLCLGGNVFGWTADRDASFAVLDAYVEAGGNFIDTADTYMRPNMGISETIIGEWMAARGNRDSLVIATKVGSDGGLSAANIAAHVDESLARLQTDRIDLYYAHKDDGSVPVEETVRAFDSWCATARSATSRRPTSRRERLVESLELAAREGLAPYVWLQPHYNLVEREGYEREYAPIVAAHGLAVAPYYALASGFLTGKYRDGSADGDSPRAEHARRSTSTRAARRVLGGAGRGRRRARRRRSPRSRSPGSRPSPASPRRSPAPAPSSSSPRSCRPSVWSLDRRRDRPTRRGLRIDGLHPPDLPRRALRARPRPRRAARGPAAAPPQRRARDRRAARRPRARDARHARARDRHLQRLLDDLARRRRRGRRRHRPQPRDRGRAHRPGRATTSSQAGVDRRSSSCARRTPPRRCAASPTTPST